MKSKKEWKQKLLHDLIIKLQNQELKYEIHGVGEWLSSLTDEKLNMLLNMSRDVFMAVSQEGTPNDAYWKECNSLALVLTEMEDLDFKKKSDQVSVTEIIVQLTILVDMESASRNMLLKWNAPARLLATPDYEVLPRGRDFLNRIKTENLHLTSDPRFTKQYLN